MEYGKDLLAALAVILNCLPSAMLALSMGFSVLATAIGFAVGAFGLAASGQVAVFSFQPETLLLLSRLSEDRNERLTITVCSSAFVFLLGVTGILGRIVTFIGDGAGIHCLRRRHVLADRRSGVHRRCELHCLRCVVPVRVQGRTCRRADPCRVQTSLAQAAL